MSERTYKSINEFVEVNGLKKGFVAERWKISRFQMTALLNPGKYPVTLTDEQAALISADLNWSTDRVLRLVA